jgi:hypothetical protein
MSETPEEKEPELTGPHNADQEVDPEKQAAEEAEIEELNDAIDVTSDLV